MIVCNGQPFITPQLHHIYKLVDQIIISEGPDQWFERIIQSKRSNDGTIEAIHKFIKKYDTKKKITLLHTNCDKNSMVVSANKRCTGKYIYHVDVDEFMTHEAINKAFTLLEKIENIAIPQRWYIKWYDTYVKGPQDNHTHRAPVRFFRNQIRKKWAISHIPQNGYINLNDSSHIPVEIYELPGKLYARHYLAIHRHQLEQKISYYIERDGVHPSKLATRLQAYDKLTRHDIGQEKPAGYKGILLKDTIPFKVELLDGTTWP
jgi:glycosyltransferase involved in cell wall biosynthesis